MASLHWERAGVQVQSKRQLPMDARKPPLTRAPRRASPAPGRRSTSNNRVCSDQRDTNKKWANVLICGRKVHAFGDKKHKLHFPCQILTRRVKDNMKCGGAGAASKQGCMSCNIMCASAPASGYCKIRSRYNFPLFGARY